MGSPIGATMIDLIKHEIRETRSTEEFILFYLRRERPRLIFKISKKNIPTLLDRLEDMKIYSQAYVWNHDVIQNVMNRLIDAGQKF